MTGSYRASVGHNPILRAEKTWPSMAGQDIGGTIASAGGAFAWHPGHYMQWGRNGPEDNNQTYRINNYDRLIGPYPQILGVSVQYYWGNLEGDTRGDYAPGIAYVGAELTKLATMTPPRRLCIQFGKRVPNERLNTPVGNASNWWPQYLIDAGYVYELQDSAAGTLKWFLLWKAYDDIAWGYYKDMWSAIINGLKSHPYYQYLEVLRPYQETIEQDPLMTNAVCLQREQDIALHLRTIAPTKGVFIPENGGIGSNTATLNSFYDYLESIDCGYGSPDTLPRSANGNGTGQANAKFIRGLSGGPDRRGRTMICCGVEGSEIGQGTYPTSATYLPNPNVYSGTAASATSTTINLGAGASATSADYYYRVVTITSGPGVGQFRLITNYNGATKVATLNTAWATLPTSASGFTISLESGAGETVTTKKGYTVWEVCVYGNVDQNCNYFFWDNVDGASDRWQNWLTSANAQAGALTAIIANPVTHTTKPAAFP